MCVGWKYSMTMMKIVISHLLLHYEFDTKLTFDELEFKYCISMLVCQGYRLQIKERVLN